MEGGDRSSIRSSHQRALAIVRFPWKASNDYVVVSE